MRLGINSEIMFLSFKKKKTKKQKTKKQEVRFLALGIRQWQGFHHYDAKKKVQT
jgi:hypothetical protein